MLPGLYEERKWGQRDRSHYCSHLGTASDKPLLKPQYIGSISTPETPAPDGQAARAADEGPGTTNPIGLSYADQRRCPYNLNLISIFGDETPGNKSIACDSEFCGTQLVGTGAKMTDVIVNNDFQKLNAIRIDRAGGALVRNMTFQQAEFNAVYVLETDGFVLDKLTTRGNDEYGILAFASDHGLIQRTNNYYNGDSGIYPGSGSDLNANNHSVIATRYAIEIRNNRSHHNTLGYSGTAGNSIWAHHNKFYENATGIATDSLFPGHPGLPQDHARWSHNEIYSNNNNWYTKYVDKGVCAKPMEERGYINGTVCPVIPTPVGTGVLIAGGNANRTDHNWIYDNWYAGTMQFWVPAPLRDEFDPSEAVRHLPPEPDDPQPHGHQQVGQGPRERHGPLVGRPGQRQLLGRQPLRRRQAGRQLRAHAALVRERRLALPARPDREGRGLPELQPLRPQRPGPAAPAALLVVRHPEEAGGPASRRARSAPGRGRRAATGRAAAGPDRGPGPGLRSRSAPADPCCVGSCYWPPCCC